MKALVIWMLGLFVIAPVVVQAGEIEAKVTRLNADQYKIVDDDLFLLTEYCFEMSDNEKVLLRLEEGRNQIVFPVNDNTCDIKTVYGLTSLGEGTYTLTVTRIEEEWYAVDGKGVVFKTDGCYSLAENTQARAAIEADGGGELLMFEHEEGCRIEGVYVETKLTVVAEKTE